MQDLETRNAGTVIVGGGLCGTLAAYELAKDGIPVLLLRDGRGASPQVAGFNVPGSEAGDSTESYYRDTMESARGQADPVLARILCEGSASLPAYLETLGFSFDTGEDGVRRARKSLGSSFARVVGRGNTSGAELLSLLDRKLRETGAVTVAESTRALRLFTKDGRITGVLAYDRNRERFAVIRASRVLLACGGYAGIFPFTSNTRDISGDGLAMALLAGAHGTDLEFVQFEPSAAVWPEAIRGKGMITTLFYEGAILTNNAGERFMLRYSGDAERVNKDRLAKAIATELREGRGSEHGGVWFDARGVNADRMREAYAPFLKRYRDVGIDLLTEPVELANAAHTALGGVKVDSNCETNIKGLFAAGEALGNLHGANRIGGSAGTEMLVFARYVAAKIKGSPLTEPDDSGLPDSVGKLFPVTDGTPLSASRETEIRSGMRALLGKHLGVGREAAGLAATEEALASFLQEVREAAGDGCASLARKLRLENDLIAALAWTKSAALRRDSVGCHWRLDFDRSPQELYRTDVCLRNGSVQATKQPISKEQR